MMLLELASGIWIFFMQQSVFYFVNLISIATLWILTALLSVPIHQQLERNQLEKKNTLTLSNWLRTFVWTVRSLAWVFVISRQTERVVL